MFSVSTRKQGKFPFLVIIGGNVLALASSLKDARDLVTETAGISFLPYIFAVAAVIILIGYLTALALIVRRSLIDKPTSLSAVWFLLAFPLTILFIFINFTLLPAEIDILDVSKKQQQNWAKQLASYEEPRGGLPPTVSVNSQESQVFTTAQGLTALMSAKDSWIFNADLLRRHFEYIERSRIPEPEGGWGYYSNFDWGVTEVAAWVLVSEAKAIKSQDVWPPREEPIIIRRIERDVHYLVSRQYEGGGWSPIGLGYPAATRTYSTTMALWALIEAGEIKELNPLTRKEIELAATKGIRWLFNSFSQTYAWAPNPNRKPDEFSQGLSTQTFFVLDRARRQFPFISAEPAFEQARKVLLEKGESLRRDIYDDNRMNDADQHLRGSDKIVEGSTYLWFPWSLASYTSIATDPEVDPRERERAHDLVFNLMLRANDFERISAADGLFKIAENLFCMAVSQQSMKKIARMEESNLMHTVSHLAKSLPLNHNERSSPYLPYIATINCIFILILATRISVWRTRAPKLSICSGKDLPEVTVLLPVRNEERNVSRCLRSLLQQSVRPRIRVIDDSSEDSTTEIVENIIKGQKQASLLRARPLPVGWRGKVHALSIGIQEVKSPWILSTDADTWHHPELLARAQETIETVNLDSLSIAGFQEAVGLGENMMIPPVFSLLDGLLGDWRDAAKGDSDIANGQFILVRRKALESIGGFASIRNEALDDVALIERLRSRNFRHSFFRAQDLLRIRMYHGLREAFHGWRRIFGSFLASQHVVFIYVLSILLLPPTVILVSLLARDWLSALVVWLGGAFSSGINRASSKHSPFYAFLYPFDSLLLAACLIASWIDARMGRLASWKGRSIVLEEQ